MELTSKEIEEIYRNKITLFRELRDCIALERENLINLDISNLWAVMEEKEKLLASIDEARNRLKGIVEEDDPYRHIPEKDRSRMTAHFQTLAALKEEIKTRVRENVSFVTETLDFFHELIAVMTMGDRSGESYGPQKSGLKEKRNLFYSNEV